jgi:hypothetical protein
LAYPPPLVVSSGIVRAGQPLRPGTVEYSADGGLRWYRLEWGRRIRPSAGERSGGSGRRSTGAAARPRGWRMWWSWASSPRRSWAGMARARARRGRSTAPARRVPDL